MPKQIDENVQLNITVYKASTILIAFDNSRNIASEWEENLAESHWVKQEGMVGTKDGKLESILRKDILANDITSILLPKFDFMFTGVIFVTGILLPALSSNTYKLDNQFRQSVK